MFALLRTSILKGFTCGMESAFQVDFIGKNIVVSPFEGNDTRGTGG